MLINKRRKFFYIIIGIFGLVFFINSTTLPPLVNAQRKGGKQKAATAGGSPEELFSRGVFYLDNNDVTDKAAAEFGLLMRKYPKSQEAQKAQFFLGSYYQRKYNILSKRRQDSADLEHLYKAEKAYQAYIDKYPNDGPCECLADAYFNLALVHMQSGYSGKAGGLFNKLKEIHRVDSRVYIYQVVWSSSSKDIIDSHFDTRRLGEYAYTINVRDFDDFTALLKTWCRSEKSRN
jgi:tetratricopeptide (TPR) repeat protein